MTDSASDLELLMEPLYGKGKKGIQDQKWFAENFSLWARNKKELVDPRLNDLLRQMDKGTVKNKATLEKWFGELD